MSWTITYMVRHISDYFDLILNEISHNIGNEIHLKMFRWIIQRYTYGLPHQIVSCHISDLFFAKVEISFSYRGNIKNNANIGILCQSRCQIKADHLTQQEKAKTFHSFSRGQYFVQIFSAIRKESVFGKELRMPSGDFNGTWNYTGMTSSDNITGLGTPSWHSLVLGDSICTIYSHPDPLK